MLVLINLTVSDPNQSQQCIFNSTPQFYNTG